MTPSNLFKGIVDFFKSLLPWSKTRVLFEKLKNDPTNATLTQQVHDLYANDPGAVVAEVLRRVSKVQVNKPNIAGPKMETSAPEASMPDAFRKTWENTIHKERVQPLQYLEPNNRQALIDIVQQAEQSGLLIRPVGMGHSFSDVANATDILVDMTNLNNTLPLEQDTFKANVPVLFSAEAGMLVEKINAELDNLGLALPAMAAFDQETIYGAIATSTHGTGIRVAGMSAMVRSMDIIAAGGKCYRLEPANGITDPVKFNTKYPGGTITLLQDDDKFYSAVVGFGLMGIVYSIVIEPVKTFYLKQRLWVTDWDTVKPKLVDRSFFTATGPDWASIAKDPVTNEYPPTRAQLFVNPYSTKKFWNPAAGHTCVVQIQTEISKAEFDALNAQVTKHPTGKLLALVLELVSDGSIGVHEETITAEDANSIAEEISTDALLDLLNLFPTLTPIFLDISLVVLLSGSGKFGKSYTVMNQGKLAIKNAGYSVEPGLAVDPANSFVKGAEEIMRVIALSQQSYSYLTSPLCMRFVKASRDYLSPEYGVDTCMIDVPLLLGTIGDDQMMERVQLDLVAMGARPHWGKICTLVNGAALIEKMYPKFQQFTDTVTFFNPNNTFNSSFSYRTGISKMLYKRE